MERIKLLSGIASILVGLSVTSSARIGETMDEAVKRYGQVVQHETMDGKEYYLF
jgi:hypothetical protein